MNANYLMERPHHRGCYAMRRTPAVRVRVTSTGREGWLVETGLLGGAVRFDGEPRARRWYRRGHLQNVNG